MRFDIGVFDFGIGLWGNVYFGYLLVDLRVLVWNGKCVFGVMLVLVGFLYDWGVDCVGFG